MADYQEILKENVRSFLASDDLIYNRRDFTSATILYFKALFSCLDIVILRKTGKVPKDHSERFRILETLDFNLYKILDELYPIYRDTYNLILDEKICKKVKKNVKRIIEEQRIL